VTDLTSVTKRLARPAAGQLEFAIETVTFPHYPDQRLVVYTVAADSPTAGVLPLLSSWGADTPTSGSPSGLHGLSGP
jgi:transcription regulator MmyB-like protein